MGRLADGLHCRCALHSPARWYFTLSYRFPLVSPGTATRTRWQPACCLCRPHRSLSSLPVRSGRNARAMALPRRKRAASVLFSGREASQLPLPPPLLASHPILWGDWERRSHRREVVKLLRSQRVDVRLADTSPPAQLPPARPLSRAERAHWRLSWAERLARNARERSAPCVDITLFGVPSAFAALLGLSIV